jgi:hypothetical protein
MKNINDFELTKHVTVGQLKTWISKSDDASKRKIINLISHRFTNRYTKHLRDIDSGFLKMAISCLTIETLESFKQGKENTKGRGVGLKMFKDFFETEQSLFPGFIDIYDDFYYSIRCGILHQAETTNAWRILRSDVLLDTKKRTINATKFVAALERALDNYVRELEVNDLDSRIWKNALVKLEDICKNCQVKD